MNFSCALLQHLQNRCHTVLNKTSICTVSRMKEQSEATTGFESNGGGRSGSGDSSTTAPSGVEQWV